MEDLQAYLPEDRRRALALGEPLPSRTHGAVLLADISGFTPLTEALVRALGPRRGTELLPRYLDEVYDTLIAAIHVRGGTVIGFSGDGITCWFAGDDGSVATACAAELQAGMRAFADLRVLDGGPIGLSLKVAVASGAVRRLTVGDPEVQLLDVLAGETLSRVAAAERLASRGEIVLDEPTARRLAGTIELVEWRDGEGGERFVVVRPPRVQAVTSSSPPLPSLSAAQLRPWLVPVIRERLLAGRGEFLTELRPVAALFVRFSGIDYDEDDAAGEKLDSFVRRVQGILVRYEGTLVQLTIGDKGSFLYGAFGAPIAHEDDARRGVRAALELREAAAALDFLEPVQIGLGRGLMRVGAYGGSTRRTYGVLGDEANLAARLMSEAQPGEVLVSGQVHQVVATEFACEPRPPIALKGKAEPLPVFAVTSRRSRRAMRLQEPSYALPMVGRRAELAAISERLDLALQGQGQVVGIVAEAGVGKSRLVAEVVRIARHKGFVGYGGACQSDGVNTPYLVWKGICSAFFDVDSQLPLRKQVRWLEGELAERAPARLSALPLLGPTLGLPLPDNDFTRSLDPQTRKSVLHALLEDCLKSAAREEPLLLVFEDLHWIDALSHDLLEEVARFTTNLPVVLVLAYRPPRLVRLVGPRLEALANFTRIDLRELSTDEAEQAVRAKLAQLYPARDASVPPGLVEKLMRRAQGNPFYLEELLNYLHDRGLDARDPAALDTVDLPDTLHALILSRIDGLSEREKTTLRVASIIGRLFRAAWLPGYYPALGDMARVKADLDELDRLEITPLDTPEPELTYLFKHIVNHEVTYQSLPHATRASLHERLADYLEIAYADNPPLAALAFHYGRSENQEKRREYLRKAGEAAQREYANEAALDAFGQLLPLLRDVTASIDVHMQRGAVLERVGRYDEAEADYEQALRLAEHHPSGRTEQAAAQFALGRLCRYQGRYEAALSWLEQAKAGRTAIEDRRGLAQSLVEIGAVLWTQGDHDRATERLNAGLELMRELGDASGMASALNSLGIIAWYQGEYATAWSLHEEGLALRREVADRSGIAASLNNLGLVAQSQNDRARARALYEQSLHMYREMGDKQGCANALGNVANIVASQGAYAKAQAMFEENLAMWREIGNKMGIAISLNYLADVLKEQGDCAAAHALLEEGLALATELGHKSAMANALHKLGCVWWLLGDAAAAAQSLADGLALFRELKDKEFVAAALLMLGVLELPANPRQARDRILESLRLGRQLDSPQRQAAGLVGIAGLALHHGNARRAALSLGAALAACQTHDVRLPAELVVLQETLSAEARAALDEPAFTAAWAEGEAMPLEAVVAAALDGHH
jgi:adenylate cyclase